MSGRYISHKPEVVAGILVIARVCSDCGRCIDAQDERSHARVHFHDRMERGHFDLPARLVVRGLPKPQTRANVPDVPR